MRVAVWELTGDDAPAEVVIFYFGEGSGGGVEANLARWFGQFEQPDGSSTRDRATITERTVNGLELTVADMRGTFVAPVRPGAPQRNNRPGYRMIGAVAEGRHGPVVHPACSAPKRRWRNGKRASRIFLSSLRLE